MADAARAAKDKLTRRFSFHARTPNKSPEKHTPVSQSARARPESAPQAPLVSANQPIANALPRDIPGSVSALPTDHSIHVQVRHWVLEGNGTGLRKSGKLAEWKKKAGPYKTVKVEANPAGLAPTSLYACHKMINSPLAEPFRETQFITSRPEYVDTDTIVYQDTPFEIAVVGMSVSRHDFKLGYPDHNEILMYSLHRGPAENDETDALPCIHYDPSKDDSGRGSIPDQFIPIPASKSLFMASNGFEKGIEPRTSVNCQFKILELDQVDHYTQLSLSGIEQLTNQFSQFSRTPNLGLLTPAMNLASTMSRKAIDSHATSDKVLMIDMNFYLAERKRPEINPTDGSEIPFEHRSGEYLRFGYYFFLSKKVDAKLYASFRTFPNVSLMMKRTDTDNLGPGEHEFFPLTGVSYLVIRVMPKMSSMRATRRPIRLSHVQRLENLMKTSLVSKEDPKDVVSHLADLAKDLGICTDDVDGDVSEVSRPADSSTSQNEH